VAVDLAAQGYTVTTVLPGVASTTNIIASGFGV